MAYLDGLAALGRILEQDEFATPSAPMALAAIPAIGNGTQGRDIIVQPVRIQARGG